ncbi:MAG: hypothetical protein ACLQIJ_15380, partial [Polyangia bacterium]
MNAKKKEPNECRNLEEQRNRESIRPRSACAGEVRHHRECACGRPRSLVRHGRRWYRLGGCRRCLAAPAAPFAASSLKG